MAQTVEQVTSDHARAALTLIDCDVHNAPNSISELQPFLSKRWQQYVHDSGFAVRDTCPHQGAALSNGSVAGNVLPCQVGETQQYAGDGEILRCPWHGWQFELRTGRSLVDPEHTRIRSYPVRVENDRVLVALGESVPHR